MINLSMLLQAMSNRLKVICLFCLLIVACTEAEKKTDYVARVNESFLTESELNGLIESKSLAGFSRQEIIDRWIREEMLFQEAAKKGIVSAEDYKRIIQKSEKELAAAMLLQANFAAESIKTDPQELVNYFNSRKEEFTLGSNSYILNILKSDDNAFAVEFRAKVLEAGWEIAAQEFQHDPEVVLLNSNILIKEENLYPQRLARIVKGLYPPEISIVISDEGGYHWVVQVIKVLKAGSTAPYEHIKDDVEKRFIAESKRKMADAYINSLYKNYNIELNN
jgi:hypothetical protein